MSTLKRSRSFRASVKLMSKIRDHANLRLTAGFDLSKDPARERNLDVLRESRDEGSTSLSWKSPPEDASPRVEKKSDDEGDPRRMSAHDADSREIARDLKSKLSLTDRIMGKGRRDADRPSTKAHEDAKSPRVIRIFRKKHSARENTREDARGKDDRGGVSCETRAPQLSKHVSYENPTFVLDSSLDSSLSSFLFEEEEGKEGK